MIVNMPQALSSKVIDDHHRHAGQGGHDNEERGDRRGSTRNGTEEVSRDLGQRQAVEADRGHQHNKVVYSARQAGADDDPSEAREKSPLGGKHRADQRPRPGDRGEMDAEEHQAPRRLVVDVVAKSMRGGDVLIVQHGHAGGQEGPVEPIGHQEGRQGRDYQPK